MRTYTTAEVMQLAGATVPQIQHAVTLGLITPTGNRFSFGAVVALAVLLSLPEMGDTDAAGARAFFDAVVAEVERRAAALAAEKEGRENFGSFS